MDNPFKSPNVLSFCPGFLGLERGLERAIGEIKVISYVEIEAFICANLVAWMEAGILAPAPIWTDVKTFPANGFRNKIHGIIGGYPCQPFSVAGHQKGNKDPRHLWPYILSHIETIRPVWCFFENVRAHLTLGYDEVYRGLSDAGYAVECGIFTAEEVGAPHERERLFIFAIRKDYLEYTCVSNEWPLFREFGKEPTEQYVASNAGNSKELANAKASVGRQERSSGNESKCTGAGSTSGNDKKMGNPTGFSKRKSADKIIAVTNERKKRNELSNSGKLANAEGKRIQGNRPNWKRYLQSWNRQRIFTCDGGELWPSRPGQEQYEWEEKRTIKPGMGCTINGYSFKEDLLRAYGNSVVEQTAELAFTTLFQKMIDSVEKSQLINNTIKIK